MIGTASTSFFQPDWFNLVETGSGATYAIPKKEFQSQVNDAFANMEKRAVQAYRDFTVRVKQSDSDVRLTEEQRKYLEENFDPKNMSLTEYQSFLDKLCEYGVLDEADKDYLGYGLAGCSLDMTPIHIAAGRSVRITPANSYNPKSYTSAFSSSGGNVLDWASYLAGITVWDTKSGSWQKQPEAILFGKVRDVLNAIS